MKGWKKYLCLKCFKKTEKETQVKLACSGFINIMNTDSFTKLILHINGKIKNPKHPPFHDNSVDIKKYDKSHLLQCFILCSNLWLKEPPNGLDVSCRRSSTETFICLSSVLLSPSVMPMLQLTTRQKVADAATEVFCTLRMNSLSSADGGDFDLSHEEIKVLSDLSSSLQKKPPKNHHITVKTV